MGRPAGAKNKAKESAIQNCENCLCAMVITNSALYSGQMRCRFMPETVIKHPQEWCRQWEQGDPASVLPLVPSALTAAPDLEELHPNDTPLP